MSKQGEDKGKVVQAEPVGHDPDLLPIKQAKANYIVIAVVVLVGVFFGMGPVLTTISESGRQQRFVEEVSNADLRTMAATGRGLAQISTIPEFRNLAFSRQMAPEYIVAGWFENARVADQNGLVPRGETLTAIVADFLQQPDVSGESTVLAVLQERQGTPDALQMKHVERLLQLVYAGRALEMRYSHTPLVAQASSETYAGLGQFIPQIGQSFGGDQVEVQSITLRIPDDLIVEAETAITDQATIQTTYEELQQQYFTIPEQRVVTVFAADADEIAQFVSIDDAAIEAAYNNDIARWTETAEDSTETVTSLADARSTLLTELQSDEAKLLASELIDGQFSDVIRELLQTDGKTEVTELTREQVVESVAGLQLTDGLSQAYVLAAPEQLTVRKAESGQYLFGRFGTIGKEQLSTLFNGDIVGEMFTVEPRPGLMCYVRIDEQLPSSFRPLADVQAQVVRYLAARAAYPVFLNEALELQQNVLKTGGDIEAYFADESRRQRFSAAEPASGPRDPLMDVRAASEDLDNPTGVSQRLVDVLEAEDSVILTQSRVGGETLAGTEPQLEMLAVQEYLPAPNQSPERNQLMYRQAVRQYQAQELQSELASMLQQ